MRTFHVNGMVAGVPTELAANKLRKSKVGARLTISAWNGNMEFVKTENGVVAVKKIMDCKTVEEFRVAMGMKDGQLLTNLNGEAADVLAIEDGYVILGILSRPGPVKCKLENFCLNEEAALKLKAQREAK